MKKPNSISKEQLEQLDTLLFKSFQHAKNLEEINSMHCLLGDEILCRYDKEIMSLAWLLTDRETKVWDKVRKVFDFVRDDIIFDFAPKIAGPESWYASNILKNRRGFCHQKAILFVALLRAVDLPAALVFQNVTDHILLDNRFAKFVPGGILPLHAVVAVEINNKWYHLDATLDSELCNRKGYVINNVIEGQDTLLPEYTRTGERHFTILQELGYFESYPKQFRDFLLANLADWNAWRDVVNRKHITM